MSTGNGDERDVVHKLVERIDSIAPEVLELVNHELGCLFLDCRGRYRQGFICEEVAVVCRGELHAEIWGVSEHLGQCSVIILHTLDGLALGEGGVLGLCEEAGLVTSYDALKEATFDLVKLINSDYLRLLT